MKPILDKKLLSEPISYAFLKLLGYSYDDNFYYYCPPHPANGGTYRIKFQATQLIEGNPVKGSEEWIAYLPIENSPTIRRFKTLGELNFFHKGMCGEFLF